MELKGVLKEITSLLYWSMLAACTVGPGTVVTCARAGYEQGLALVWTLIFATIMAFILQEGSARLTIQSGKSLGECLRIKYKRLPQLYDVSILCWAVSLAVFVGNNLYECNCWGGGISAILLLPGAEDTVALRVSCCIGYAIVVYGLLYWDATHYLSIGLGIVLVGMAALFLVVVIELGLDWKSFSLGILPNLPADSSNLVVALIGTTSLGFNLFLGSKMAEDGGQDLPSAQRGIAFSVTGAMIISILIMIVGDGVPRESDEAFDIGALGKLIEETIGEAGLIIFSLGFIAAALSSMLAVPLGAAQTADSMFTYNEGEKEETQHKLPRWIYHGIMLSMIIIATIVISCDVSTETIVQIASVFNGCLLPFFAICLLLCLNDPKLMTTHRQSWYANVFLILAVTISLFLAYNAIIDNIFGSLIKDETIKFIISGSLAPLSMIIFILTTSLRRDLFRKDPKKADVANESD